MRCFLWDTFACEPQKQRHRSHLMGFKIREIDAECKFSSSLTVEALDRAIPHSAVCHVLAQHGPAPQRDRKLSLLLTVWLVIALHLYPTVSIAGVLRKLVRGLRFIWADPTLPLPGESALAYRRTQLGARPIVTLFKEVCQPIATPQTQGVYRAEGGPHVVVDAGLWPCHTSERVGGFRLLRSVGRGMLLMWDRGFHDFDMVVATRQRGAHVLSRLPAGVIPQVVRGLPDGSVLAYLLPSADARRRRGERILVRVITYSITDPTLPGYGEEHRVITTLLNPRLAPAHTVACAYHERWEIEVVIDEIDTHQRLVGRTLRSLTPVGVLQELYGVLLAHYAVRVLMHEAALTADVDPDRLSFVHALEVVRDAVPEFQMVADGQQRALYERMLHDIAAKRLPARRPRSNARVVKRKMSNFKLKRAEHARPPKPRGTFADAVQVQPPPGLELPRRQLEHQQGAFLALRQRELVLI